MYEDLFDKDFDDEVSKVSGPIEELDNDLEIDEDLEEAAKYGMEEIAKLHKNYQIFIRSISHLVVFDHLKPFIKDFGKSCNYIQELISGECYKSKAPPGTDEEAYKFLMQKTRAIVLGHMWNRYGQSDDKENEGK
jgi:hypothetical protein